MSSLIKSYQLNIGTGETQVNSTTITNGSGVLSGFTGTTITDSLNQLFEKSAPPILVKVDKNITGCTSNGNSLVSGLNITYRPYEDSRVDIRINSLTYNVGETVDSDIYFSEDEGATALLFNSMSGGELVFFKGDEIGFDIEPSDWIDIDYQVGNFTTGSTVDGYNVMSYSITGDGFTTAFTFNHIYGSTEPEKFTSFETESGLTQLYEYQEIVINNNSIEIRFSNPPGVSESYESNVLFKRQQESGDITNIEFKEFSFTGNGVDDSFELSHTYGTEMPSSFISIKETSGGERYLYELDEIFFSSNTITAELAVAPSASESFKVYASYDESGNTGVTTSFESLNYYFPGDGITTVFTYDHAYGTQDPLYFESYESYNSVTQLYEFENIEFKDGQVEFTFSTAPTSNKVYEINIGF